VPASLRPAATVVVLRDSASGPEVFMVRRHERAAFMGGAYVFPGGAVDATDHQTAAQGLVDGVEHAVRQLPALQPVEAVAHHVAAARELFEEAGVLLARDAQGRLVGMGDDEVHARFTAYRQQVHDIPARFHDMLQAEGLRLAADTLVHFAQWVTPPVDTRRFDTCFFATRLPNTQRPAHDERETTDSCWMTPSSAIRLAANDEIVLPPPTWVTLRELSEQPSVEAILVWAGGRDVVRREPAQAREGDSRLLVMPHHDFAAEWGRSETSFVWSGDRWRPRL